MAFTPEPLPALPLTIPQAIARMEGWYAQGQVPNRPQRNCNPGDIEFSKFATKFGAVAGDPRFAIFSSAEDGWAALIALLCEPDYATLTLEEAVNRYAPPIENRTDLYVAAVAHWTGRQPTDVIGQYV